MGVHPGTAWAALLLVVGLVTSGCSSDPIQVRQPANLPGPSGSPKAAARTAGGAGQVAEAPKIGAVHQVAQAAVRSVAVYRDRRDGEPWLRLADPLPSKAPLVFLVLERRPGWLRVLLPVRPNQSHGWIRAQDATLSRHTYRLVVSVGKHSLTVYRGRDVVMTERVGLGTSATPTPGGLYYTKELIRPPRPDGPYGPYAYGLSGYSEALDEFLGGDGTIGIHGTSDPSGIGRDVSHGCIRMRNEAITRLARMLPLGVPVQIVA
jgi:lipoprotein-anchoring transpeptidase ErfK/SrfK